MWSSADVLSPTSDDGRRNLVLYANCLDSNMISAFLEKGGTGMRVVRKTKTPKTYTLYPKT